MKFSAPVTYTTTGWVEIEADSLVQAIAKANAMNHDGDGVDYFSIKDAEVSSAVHADEVEPIKDNS